MTAPESIYGHERPPEDTSSCDVPRWEEDPPDPQTLEDYQARNLPSLYLIFQQNGDVIEAGGILQNIPHDATEHPIADIAAWFMQGTEQVLARALQDVRTARRELAAESAVVTGDRERTIISAEG